VGINWREVKYFPYLLLDNALGRHRGVGHIVGDTDRHIGKAKNILNAC